MEKSDWPLNVLLWEVGVVEKSMQSIDRGRKCSKRKKEVLLTEWGGRKGGGYGGGRNNRWPPLSFSRVGRKRWDKLGALIEKVSLNNCTLTHFGRTCCSPGRSFVASSCPASWMTPCGACRRDLPSMNNPDASPQKTDHQQHKHNFYFHHIILFTSSFAQFCIHGYED